MKSRLTALLLGSLLFCTGGLFATAKTDLYSISLETLKGPVKFSDFRGKVLLITNTASGCGYTPQLAGLQKIFKKYNKQGLIVIGLPSDDFNQEKLDDVKIGQFCKTNYGVSFLMAKKLHVNGKKRHPLYHYLVENDPQKLGDINWNFEKFLVNRKGDVVKRFYSSTTPESPTLINELEKVLK